MTESRRTSSASWNSTEAWCSASRSTSAIHSSRGRPGRSGSSSRTDRPGKICGAGAFLSLDTAHTRKGTPMAVDLPEQALELRSLVTSQGTLDIALHEVSVAPPAANEVVVRVEASPINPSDLGVLI